MGSENVFVYGTLKRGEPNHHWITNPCNGSARLVGVAQTVELYPLVIASKYNIPFLLHHPGHGHVGTSVEQGVECLAVTEAVSGEVYSVDGAMLCSLDALEDHPRLYARSRVAARLLPAGETVACWAYLLTAFRPELLALPCHTDYRSSGPHGLEYCEGRSRDPGHELLWDVKPRGGA
ncbi:gamma-glutamylaminecyclotransferase isoform X2 [Bacillus rossius redtenbacheri]|uniref:gamma-glutamylaminecyclotransferase isoform X2 n=1 Tax=Bacillus rossius redtenbacheri TaxID=93214 RepID=UPI002FDE5ADD